MTMMLTTYLASLSPLALLRSLPGACAQGLIWGLLALGVYITYKLLDFADLTVDGSMATGGAVAVMLIRAGMNPWLALIFAFLAGMAAGFITGMLHTALGIPGILASILTQISLYSINLNILGSSNQAVSVDKYSLVVSLRYISDSTASKIRMFTTCILFCVVLVAILYWYFGTEHGAGGGADFSLPFCVLLPFLSERCSACSPGRAAPLAQAASPTILSDDNPR